MCPAGQESGGPRILSAHTAAPAILRVDTITGATSPAITHNTVCMLASVQSRLFVGMPASGPYAGLD